MVVCQKLTMRINFVYFRAEKIQRNKVTLTYKRNSHHFLVWLVVAFAKSILQVMWDHKFMHIGPETFI